MRPYGQRMSESGGEMIWHACRECPFMTKSPDESMDHNRRTGHQLDWMRSYTRGIDVPLDTEATMRRVTEKWLRGS